MSRTQALRTILYSMQTQETQNAIYKVSQPRYTVQSSTQTVMLQTDSLYKAQAAARFYGGTYTARF